MNYQALGPAENSILFIRLGSNVVIHFRTNCLALEWVDMESWLVLPLEALYDAYDKNSDLILTCQIAATLEIINPLVGIVKTGLTAPVFQVLFRLLQDV